jgi:hypothetical protein
MSCGTGPEANVRCAHGIRHELAAPARSPAQPPDIIRIPYRVVGRGSGLVPQACHGCDWRIRQGLPNRRHITPGAGCRRIHISGTKPYAGGPVSRVLSRQRYPFQDQPSEGSHSSRRRIAAPFQRPTRAIQRETRLPRNCFRDAPPLFGLAPSGVCRAAAVTDSAVRSYRTLSPLPVPPTEMQRGPSAVYSLWHFPSASPRQNGDRRAGVTRHPCFVEPGLSSALPKQ